MFNVVKTGLLRDRRTDLLGGAVRHSEFRVLFLQVLKLPEQDIKISIRDLGLLIVVEVTVIPDLLSQFIPGPAQLGVIVSHGFRF